MSWIERYNATGLSNPARRELLVERLASVGERVIIRPPFFCDPGGNLEIGDDVFLNFNCIVLDRFRVSIGAQTTIGPGVQILSADHPRDPMSRRKHLLTGSPVAVGENVWIGGGAIVLPGVTIGDNAIIGAGAVVVHDVPPGVTVVGNPARPTHR